MLEELCREHRIPNLQPEAAQLIRQLLQLRNVRRILEIGTAYGYSALHWCEAVPQAELVTIERDAVRAAEARRQFEQAGVADRVQLLEGDARHLIAGLSGSFDFVFIDAAKGHYRDFFDLSLDKLSDNGLIVSDNVLFRGMTTLSDDSDVDPRYRKMVAALRRFNEYICRHPQCTTSLLAIGDGLAVTTRQRMEQISYFRERSDQP